MPHAALLVARSDLLFEKVLKLVLSLHNVHNFTDAAATDGSKLPDPEQPAHTTTVQGPATVGVWEGIQHPVRDADATAMLQRIRRGRGPLLHEMQAAAASGVHGARIGNDATVLEAELFAIYEYLNKVVCRPRPSQRRLCQCFLPFCVCL